MYIGLLLGQVWRQRKRQPSFVLGPLQVTVQALSAFYGWGLCSCRDGIVCFFICASVLFSRAAGTPSKKRRYIVSHDRQLCSACSTPASCPGQTRQHAVLYTASRMTFTCSDLKRRRRYSPLGQAILVCLLPPCHPFSALCPRL